jgi:hypothetical protein
MSIFGGTSVSAAHPAIKSILTAIDPNWRGKKITVDQVDPDWTYFHYNDTGEPKAYRVVLGRYVTARELPRPPYGGLPTRIQAPSGGEAIVTKPIGSGTIDIYVPRLDANALDVARDALIEGRPFPASEFGPYAGIAEAIVAATAKSLEKAMSGKIKARKIGTRWQPVDAIGNIVRGTTYNADGKGYATREGAAEAAKMLQQIEKTS